MVQQKATVTGGFWGTAGIGKGEDVQYVPPNRETLGVAPFLSLLPATPSEIWRNYN